MTKDNNGDKLGYGNPPKHTQFKKGQSGNPKGRPKGVKNKIILIPGERKLDKLWLAYVQTGVKIKGANGVETIPVIEGAFQALKVKALQGNIQAIKLILFMTQTADEAEAKRKEEFIRDVLAFKACWQPIYDQRDWDEYNGKYIGPNPTRVRPEELIINQGTGEVTYQTYPTLKEQMYFEKIENRKIKCSKKAKRVLLRIVYANNLEAEDKYREVFNARKMEYYKLCEKVREPLPDEDGNVDAAHLLELSPTQLEAHENLLVHKRNHEENLKCDERTLVENPDCTPSIKSNIKKSIKKTQQCIDELNKYLTFRKM